MRNNKKCLSRREFLRLSTLGASGLVLAACVQGLAPAPPDSSAGQASAVESVSEPSGTEPVELRLSAWADVQDAVVYENMVNRWHELNENITVSVEQYPGGYYEKIQANFAAGTSADVLYYQGWIWQAYAENEVLVPLDDFIAQDKAEGFFPDTDNYRNSTQWYGKTYMTPTDVGSLVIYYNKDLFDKQGIPYPQRGWTWEEFQDIIQKLSFTEGDTRFYGWAQAGGWQGAYARNVNFMRRNGHLEWDSEVEPKEAHWDHEDVISALQFIIYDAIANNWSPGPEVITGGGVGVDTGRVAMVLEGPWYMPRLWGELATTESGINFDVVEPPIGEVDRNFNFGHVHGHTITNQSKSPEVCWELIKFILGDEGQEIIAQGGRMCGTPENIEKIWGPIASERYNFTNVEAFANGMREGSTPVILGEGAQIHAYGGGPITSLWDKLLGLQATAAEAVPEANVEIQRELDEYWRDRA
ncbi:MAG: extracellular solute-binding protein [Phycisphaerae bacterium]|nr:extracellular solute-binding protein [Phycisphaerae bacterium]NIX29164.1 extracellular solute-binding protein [Phycisphaerae bacterium]